MKKFLFVITSLASLFLISILQISNVYDYFSQDRISNAIGILLTFIIVNLITRACFLKHIQKDKKERAGFKTNIPFYIYPNGNMLLIENGKPSNRPTKVILVNKNYKTLSSSPFNMIYNIFDNIYSTKRCDIGGNCRLVNDRLEWLTDMSYKSISAFDTKMLRLQFKDISGFHVFSRKQQSMLSTEVFTEYKIYTIDNASDESRHKVYCFKKTNKKWSMYDEDGIIIESHPYVEDQLLLTGN